MCRKMFYILAVAFVFAAVGCSDDKTEDQSLKAVVSKTDFPAQISWLGGDYTIEVNYEPLTRSNFEPWEYRVLMDGVEIEGYVVANGADKIVVSVPANETEREREIAVEVKIPNGSNNPQWLKAASGRQESVLVAINGVMWARTNLTVKDGKYAFENAPERFGFYFKHMSTYGVPSEGERYAGKAYNPAETTISLGDIPERNGDPCALMSGGKLRLPTRGEMGMLFYFADWTFDQLNSTWGLNVEGGRLFLPFSGTCDAETGLIGYKNQNGGYWTNSDDGDEHGYILTMNREEEENYSEIYPSYGTGMASVRCVRNVTQRAAYVSHTPEQQQTNAAFTVVVDTDPGMMPFYFVELRDVAKNNRSCEGEIKASEGHSVEIQVPKNDDPIDVVYEIYVDDQPTGKTVFQGRKRDYAEYLSHTPRGTVPGAAFTLSVTSESDMDSFEVEVKTGSVSLVKGTGSKSNPVVQLQVPENSGQQRVLEIWVNGVLVRETIKQDKIIPTLSVVWSTGYLTVQNGAYAFAGEQEKGMFFKFKSRYGMELNASNNYTGTAYGPEAVTKAYADLSYDDIDPCSLVADGKTWRLPTYAEWEQLFLLDSEWSAGKYKMYYTEDQQVYLTPSGQLKETGSGVLLAAAIRVWSSSPGVKTPTKVSTLALTLAQQTAKPTNTEVVKNVGIMVRCVRDK